MENPYLPTSTPTIEHEEIEQTIITDTNGTSVLAREQGTQVLIDPLGGRHYRTITRLVREDGARVITDPTQTFTCACGNLLNTKETAAFCERCQHSACRHHIQHADDGQTVALLCTSCYEHGRWQRALLRTTRRLGRFLQWLTNI